MAKQANSPFQMIPVDKIFKGTLNNRSQLSTNNDADKELVESIRSVGIIHPLTVRPIDDQYELVCGNRRFDSACSLGMDIVPCMVKVLSDEESFLMVITENLQRKDIHPLDEAKAYGALMDQYGYRPVDIAEKFGKSLPYVLTRLRFTDLIPELKTSLEIDQFPIGVYDRIARLNPEQQKDIFENFIKFQSDSISVKRVESYIANRISLLLSNAIFDPESDGLYPGSCTDCQHNTASSLLFSEFGSEPRCMLKSCFENKTKENLKAIIQVTLEANPDIPFVLWNHNMPGGDSIKEYIESQGGTVYIPYKDVSVEFQPKKPAKPEKPVRKDFATKGEFEEALVSYQNEIEEYKEDLDAYDEDIIDFEKRVKEGKIFPVFQCSLQDSELNGPTYAMKYGSTSKASSSDTPTSENKIVEEKIESLVEKHERNKRLAFNKVYDAGYKLMAENNYSAMDDPLTDLEKDALILLMLEMNYGKKREILGHEDSYEVVSEKIKNLTNAERASIFRSALIMKFKVDPDVNGNLPHAGYVVDITKAYYPFIYDVEKDQNLIVEKRKVSIDKKIAELQGISDPPKDQESDSKPKKGKKKEKQIDPEPDERYMDDPEEMAATMVNSDLNDEIETSDDDD